MTERSGTLAERLGLTVHVSPLLFRIRALAREYPCAGADTPGDWLLRVANHRGARVVVPSIPRDPPDRMPGVGEFSNEELVTGLLLPQIEDRPQLLRLAAQMISRGCVSVPALLRLSRMERTERLLRDLAESALRVERGHPTWGEIRAHLGGLAATRDVLLHWTRLAEPIPSARRVAAGWRLVA